MRRPRSRAKRSNRVGVEGMNAERPDKKTSLFRFGFQAVVGPLVGFVIATQLGGWGGASAMVMTIVLGHFWTQFSIHSAVSRGFNALAVRAAEGNLSHLKEALLKEDEQLLFNRCHYITILAVLAALFAGVMARGIPGILYGFVGSAIGQFASNWATRHFHKADIDAASKQIEEQFTRTFAFSDKPIKTSAKYELPEISPLQSQKHELWLYGADVNSEERDAYFAFSEEVEAMPWQEAWREGRKLLKKLKKQLLEHEMQGDSALATVGHILAIQESHAGIVHWPRVLARLKLAGLTDSDVRFSLFALAVSLIVVGVLVLNFNTSIVAVGLVTLSFWSVILTAQGRRLSYYVFRTALSGMPGEYRTNLDDMLTRRWHTGIALLIAWPTLVAKCVFHLGVFSLGLWIVIIGHWLALVLPFMALWVAWLDLKDATVPPYMFVIGRSGPASIGLHLLLREASYPRRVVSLLDHASWMRAHGRHARDDIFRVFPQWWANQVWLFVVRHIASASGVIIYDLRSGRSEYTDREMEILRKLNLEVLFIGSEKGALDADMVVLRFADLKLRAFWKGKTIKTETKPE